jgi:uncharacterized protein YkwD
MRFRARVFGLFVVGSVFLAACSSTDGTPGGFGTNTPPEGTTPGNGATPGDDGGGSVIGGGTQDKDASSSTPPSHGADASAPSSGNDASTNNGGGNDASTNNGGGVDASTPNDGFDQFQHRNLDDVNKYRATLNVAPLVLDQQLSTFALAGAQELSQDHMAHQHFINASNNGTLWSSGFKSSAAENQGDPNGWPVKSQDATQNELLQIDDIQKSMFDEGPGTGEAHGHYTNMMNPKLKRLGVGLLEVSGHLYLTNDFSE